MRKWGIEETWPVSERILVSIGPVQPRVGCCGAGKRMAVSLNAEWLSVYVETPEHAHLSPEERDRIAQALRLAEQLGAETDT